MLLIFIRFMFGMSHTETWVCSPQMFWGETPRNINDNGY